MKSCMAAWLLYSRGLITSRLIAFFLCFGLCGWLEAQTLQHEWSFNESGGTTAFDSIGGANITLLGATSLGGGVLNLPGGAGNFAQFPNGILSTYTNSITLETWLTDNGGLTWARVWSFGGSTTGPNTGFTHGNYIDLIPNAGNANGINGGFWTEFNHNGTNRDAADLTPLATGTEVYATVVYDGPSQTVSLYLNGGQVGKVSGVAFKPADLGFTYNNFIGLDQYNDAIFDGTVDEMRIWNGSVSQRYIAASSVVGPGVIITNITPTTASLTAGPSVVLTGTEQAEVAVELPQTGTTNLIVTGDATNWTSGNPSVLSVDRNGVISGVGVGTATVSATIAGINVTSGSITVLSQTLQHEWSFNESGGTTASDSVGGASITLSGTASLGGGVLTLPGGAGNYAQFPNGILSSNGSVTIETWLTDNGGQTWARAWSFGGSTNGPNNNFIQDNYIDLIPTAGGAGGMWTEFRANVPATTTFDIINKGNAPLHTATEQYVAITYNQQNQTCIMYSNGVPVASGPGVTPSSMGFTYNNYLGLDQWNDAVFNGTFDEMRIWNGVVTPVYLVASAAAGPGVVITNTAVQTLSVSVNTSMVGSQTQQAAVTGSFIQVANVNLTGVTTNWTSSNPSILTVNTNGLITGVSGGTATVSGTVNGVTAVSSAITVASTAPTISQAPGNQNAVIGDHVLFAVQALGGGLSYQWSFDTSPISGATNATLALTNVTFAEAGTYSVLVSNSISTTNVSATLTVTSPVLEHEWSFNESGGTTATDAVAGANITLVGSASLGGGILTLPGGAGNYAQFPNGILSTFSNSISIETWFTDNGGLTWARPWSFGGSTVGPNNGFSANNYIDLIPTAGNANGINGGFWTEFNHDGNTDAFSPTPLPTGVEEYVTVTYEVSSQTVRLYLNGTQVATATNVAFSPSDLGFTYNNFLGLDQYNDPIFDGTIDEMRIWNGTVTPLYILLSTTAGPAVVVTNDTATSLDIAVNADVVIGQTQQATVTANFSQVSGVPVTTLVTNWVSSNPGVLTVNSNGFITAASGGTATISATLNGVAGSSALITVSQSAPVITQNLPASERLLVGTTLRTSLGNVGSPPFTYFWFTNNAATPISVSASPALTVPNLRLVNGGNYVCVASNQYGTATSSVLNLTVVSPTPYQQVMVSLGPIAFWPLNETAGTTAYDLIGGDNGTYTGTFTLGASGPTNTYFGGNTAAGFDGTTGHVDIPGGPLNLTNAITIVAWVDLISAPGFDGLFGHGDSSWRMSVNPSSQPGGNDGDAQADATDPAGPPGIDDNFWHLVAYSYTGDPGQNNNGALYVDGVLVANNTVTTNPAMNNLDVWIGGSPDYPTSRFLPAYIANAAVFGQALTASQVQGIYNGVAVVGPQTITITRSGANVVLNWQTGTLLQATNLLGPWTTNGSATPGYTVPIAGGNQFFRLLVNP